MNISPLVTRRNGKYPEAQVILKAKATALQFSGEPNPYQIKVSVNLEDVGTVGN